MPPPQIFSLDGHAFGLTVSGVQVIKHAALDVAPIRWDMPWLGQNGGMTFVLEDDGSVAVTDGAIVRLTDNVTNRLLSSGVVVNRRHRRSTGPWQFLECTVAGWGMFLDERHVWDTWAPQWSIKNSSSGRSLTHDLIATYGGPIIPHPDTVAEGFIYVGDPLRSPEPPWSMASATKTTVRSALDSIWELWDSGYGTATSEFVVWVDDQQRLHRAQLPEAASVVGTAPARLGDGDYVAELLSDEELVAHWTDRTTSHGGIDLDWGGMTLGRYGGNGLQDDTTGVVNQPAHPGWYLDGSAWGTAISAALPGALEWSYEVWFRVAGTAAQTLWTGEDIASPTVLIEGGTIKSMTAGGSVEASSTATFNDDLWHHLVVTHQPSVGGTIFVDGSAAHTASTARTFAAPGTMYVGADNVGGVSYTGYLNHLAVWDSVLTADTFAAFASTAYATTAFAVAYSGNDRVSEHWVTGITFAPEDLTYEVGSERVRHRLYAYDTSGTGAGWVPYAAPYWEAGEFNAIFDSTHDATVGHGTSYAEIITEASAYQDTVQPITSASFVAANLKGWAPGQAILLRDARLTGGAWETQYVGSVSGEIGMGGVITYRVTTNTPTRSLVQAVAAP